MGGWGGGGGGGGQGGGGGRGGGTPPCHPPEGCWLNAAFLGLLVREQNGFFPHLRQYFSHT